MAERALEGVKDLETTIAGFNKVIGKLQTKPPEFSSDIYFWETVKSQYERIHEANLSGKPLIFSGMFVPSEIYHAMDIACLFTEYNSTMMAGRGDYFQYMDIAEGHGISNEICSPHRVAIGLAKSKMLPRPTAIVSTATTCDQTLKLYEVLADYYQVPSYLVDSAFGYQGHYVDYMREEVKGMIAFLEEQTGKKMDYDRLKEVLHLSRQVYDYWEKIADLKKAIPCPIGSKDSMKDWGVIMNGAGTPEGVSYFKARYEEVKERVEKGIGAAREEKHRVAWLYALPLFDLGVVKWMAEEHGAVIVFDTFGMVSKDIILDPEDPIGFLAQKASKMAFIKLGWAPNEVSRSAEEMADLCTEYQVDCAIVLAHWSCRQYCGTIKILRDAVVERADIPFMILDGDLMDSRVVSSEQMKQKITEFLDTIGAQTTHAG